MDLLNPESCLDLNNIRHALIRMEDTIIFKLIERAALPTQSDNYKPGSIPVPNWEGTFLDWMLLEVEECQAKVRRYTAPDEVPFNKSVLNIKTILPPIDYPPILFPNPNRINCSDKLKQVYIDTIVPKVCRPGSQSENLGSSVVADVECLQTLSRRIHFGKFVAESKFRSQETLFTRLIRNKDSQGLAQAITNDAVEAMVLKRLKTKADTYGVDPNLTNDQMSLKVDTEAVVSIYRDVVIPLTKEVEVEYLLHRLD